MSKDIIVIGAGISGMGAAYALQKQGFNVTVLEKSDRVGGRMYSINWHGDWIDLGAEYLSNKESGLFELIDELGLSSSVIEYPTVGQVMFETWRENSGHVVSLSNPISFLSTAPFKVADKMGLVKLLPASIRYMFRVKFQPRSKYSLPAIASDDDESLESWLSSTHPDFLNYVLEPMHEFMWTHEPQEIARGWALDFYLKHMKLKVCSLAEGYGMLPRVLATKLNVITNARVNSIVPGDESTTVAWDQDGQAQSKTVDGVIVAVPGTKIKDMVQGLDDERLKFFEGVRYSPQEIPFFKLKREMPELPMMRLYSRKEDPVLNAITYTAPRPDGEKFLRGKVKGREIRRNWQQTDAERIEAVEKEIARYYPDISENIEDRMVHRWQEALPIFYPGYSRSLQKFLALPPIPGLAFAGDYLTAGDTGAAYLSGLWAAEDLMQRLHSTTDQPEPARRTA